MLLVVPVMGLPSGIMVYVSGTLWRQDSAPEVPAYCLLYPHPAMFCLQRQ